MARRESSIAPTETLRGTRGAKNGADARVATLLQRLESAYEKERIAAFYALVGLGIPGGPENSAELSWE
jgi:hypothetical protein